MRLRAILLASAITLPGCDDDGAPKEAEVAGYVVTVPEGWTPEREVRGPRYTLTLRPPGRDAFCQVAVIRDGRIFRDDDARALLGDGRATFGSGEAAPLRLETAAGPMQGVDFDQPRVPASWGVRGPPGDARLEMYAAPRQDRLITALVATSRGSGEGDGHRQRCLEAVRSLR